MLIKEFKNLLLPKRITPSPIKEAVFELRFESKIPETVLCGFFYSIISKNFSGTMINELPIVQIPSDIRNNDPNLKFQPHYKVAKDNYIIAFGPMSMMFSCIEPYSGWDDWSKLFFSIIEDLSNNDNIKDVNIKRLGLRYIDKIDGNLFENTRTDFSISNLSLSAFNTQVRTEIKEEEILIILNMVNNIKQLDKESFYSIFDIDCVAECDTDFRSFDKDLIKKGLLDKLHRVNKQYFFGLLKEDFLLKLNPQY